MVTNKYLSELKTKFISCPCKTSILALLVVTSTSSSTGIQVDGHFTIQNIAFHPGQQYDSFMITLAPMTYGPNLAHHLFYQNTAILIHLCIVCGCFCMVKAELNIFDILYVAQKAENTNYLASYKKKKVRYIDNKIYSILVPTTDRRNLTLLLQIGIQETSVIFGSGRFKLQKYEFLLQF